MLAGIHLRYKTIESEGTEQQLFGNNCLVSSESIFLQKDEMNFSPGNNFLNSIDPRNVLPVLFSLVFPGRCPAKVHVLQDAVFKCKAGFLCPLLTNNKK